MNKLLIILNMFLGFFIFNMGNITVGVLLLFISLISLYWEVANG